MGHNVNLNLRAFMLLLLRDNVLDLFIDLFTLVFILRGISLARGLLAKIT